MRDADSLSLEARSSHGRSLRHPGSDPDVAAAADVASTRDEMPVNPRTVRTRKRLELTKEVMVYKLACTKYNGKQRRCYQGGDYRLGICVEVVKICFLL